MEISSRDWKLFREKLPAWQEAYMDRLCREYMALLSGEGGASNKFWALEKRIREDKQSPGVIASINKRDTPYLLMELLNDKVIVPADIMDFSDELRNRVLYLAGFRK